MDIGELEYHVYLDLDSIFDVRHVILCKLYPELGIDLTMSGEYQNRVSNIFKSSKHPVEAHNDVINAYYKVRNKGDLSLAGVNSIPLVLAEHLNNEVETAKNGTDSSNLVIYINIYPYKLTEEEQNNVCLMLRQFYSRYIEFRIVNFQPHQVTPRWLVDNEIKIAFVEDIMGWFECNDNRDLGSHALHKMSFVTPKVNPKGNLHLSDENWAGLTKLLSLITTVEFLPLKAYSALKFLNINKK